MDTLKFEIKKPTLFEYVSVFQTMGIICDVGTSWIKKLTDSDEYFTKRQMFANNFIACETIKQIGLPWCDVMQRLTGVSEKQINLILLTTEVQKTKVQLL